MGNPAEETFCHPNQNFKKRVANGFRRLRCRYCVLSRPHTLSVQPRDLHPAKHGTLGPASGLFGPEANRRPRIKSEGPTNAMLNFGADGGGRTHTSVKTLDFESSASANSATSALLACETLRHGGRTSIAFAQECFFAATP